MFALIVTLFIFILFDVTRVHSEGIHALKHFIVRLRLTRAHVLCWTRAPTYT